MNTYECEHGITNYVKDGETILVCATCKGAVHTTGSVKHIVKTMTDADFLLPTVDEGYKRLIKYLIENAEIFATLPNVKAIECFRVRYSRIKGKAVDENCCGYREANVFNPDTWNYALHLRVRLPEDGSITRDDFSFSKSEYFQISDNCIHIQDCKWIHGLLKNGFDIDGCDHDVDYIYEAYEL